MFPFFSDEPISSIHLNALAMTGPAQVVLATSSKFRQKLFADHFPDVQFTAESPSIDEKAIAVDGARHLLDPHALTLSIAHAKAHALVTRLLSSKASTSVPQSSRPLVILTFDQVVVCHGHIREKPESVEQCRQFLQSYSVNPLQTVTAIVVTIIDHPPSDWESGQELPPPRKVDGVDIATQHFRDIPDPVVDQLIAKGEVMQCAGGITVEDPLLEPYLLHRDGTLDSIMGLPVDLLRKLLHKTHVDLSTTSTRQPC